MGGWAGSEKGISNKMGKKLKRLSVVLVGNEKGGVAKTTNVTALAAGLSLLGYEVLIIDGDPQGHVAESYGIQKESGLYDLLANKKSWNEVIRRIPPERYGGKDDDGLFAVFSDHTTHSIPVSGASYFDLDTRIQQLQDSFDVVLIDVLPSPGFLHGMYYTVADAIIYPTQCNSLSFSGLRSALAREEGIRQTRFAAGLKLEKIGIIPTFYDSRTLEQKELLELLKRQYGELVWEPQRLRTLYPEAARAYMPIMAYAPKSDAAQDMWKSVRRLEAWLRGQET